MTSDTLSLTLDLLSSNWNAASTDAKTPGFIKVTDVKRYDFNINADVVIALRPTETDEPAGVSNADKNEQTDFNLDVRSIGREQEQHWYNILNEIKRILKANKINPFLSSFPENHVLEWNGNGTDLSDKNFNLWRKLMPVQIQRLNVNR